MMLSRYPVYRLQVAGYSLFAKIARKKCFGYHTMTPYLEGKSGVEVGGPSSIFCPNHLIPVYDVVRSIDSLNFAQDTIWSSKEGHLKFGSRLGKQFIAEACDATGIPDESYDFVAASHVLEHVANPLRALREWKRILRPSGTVLVVVPHKDGMFDHRRPFTTFDHILRDFESNVTEADLTHLPEILQLHDLQLDPPAGSLELFHERCLKNLSNRAIHHHVFSPELLVEMFDFLGLRTLNVAVERPYHIIVHAGKQCRGVEKNPHLDNVRFLDAEAEWRGQDPFRRKYKKSVN